jgi:Na+/H+ antiporter NhaC
MAFGNLLLKRLRSKGQSLFATWILGLFIFLDDYLNSLTVGATMKAVTDRFKTSRAMLAYVIDSTAAPLCLLVPISSWGAYFAGLLEKNAVAADGQGLSLFIESIPYMFYPLVAVFLVPVVALGFIPRIGPMRKAEELAEATGDLGATDGDTSELEFGNGGPSTFFLPIFALLFFTVFPSVDLLRGVIAGILVTVVYFASLRLMPLSELFDTCTNGIKIMVPVLAMLLALFVFVEANDRIGPYRVCHSGSEALYECHHAAGHCVYHHVSGVIRHGIKLGCHCDRYACRVPAGAGLRRQYSARYRCAVIGQWFREPCVLLFRFYGAISSGRGV